MKKTIVLFPIRLLLLSLFPPTAAQAKVVLPYNVTVYDSAGFFTAEEEIRLESMRGEDTHGVSFYLVTATVQMSASRVHSVCAIGEKSAVVLVIDSTGTTYYYEMFTFNGADDLFSDRDVDDILDADSVYRNIKRGDLYEGCESFFGLCQQVIAKEIARQNAFPWPALIAGVIGGVLIGGITVLCVFLFYRKKRHGVSYPLDRYATLNLTEHRDLFVGSYVTRVRVQSNSSGGSSSGGGGFSGGSRGRR
jgi:uncharacterized membrane protein YgcG